jgi:hypothetical protein
MACREARCIRPAWHQIADGQADSAEGSDGSAQHTEVVPQRRSPSGDRREDHEHRQHRRGDPDWLLQSPGQLGEAVAYRDAERGGYEHKPEHPEELVQL